MSRRNLFLLAGFVAIAAIALVVSAISFQTDRLALAFGIAVSAGEPTPEARQSYDDWWRWLEVSNEVAFAALVAVSVGGLPLAILAAVAAGRPRLVKWLAQSVAALWSCLTLQLTTLGFALFELWLVAEEAPAIVTVGVVAYAAVNLWAVITWRELLLRVTSTGHIFPVTRNAV